MREVLEALGVEAANESRKLFEACKASDDAVKAEARKAALVARQAKVDAIERRKAAMLRTDDKPIEAAAAARLRKRRRTRLPRSSL